MNEKETGILSAIYLRVSPTTKIKTIDDLHQSLVESLNVCKRDIEHEGNIPVAIYIDEYISGKSSKDMPGFQRMLQDARTGSNTSLDKDLERIGSPQKLPWKRMYARRVNRFGRNRADMIRAEIELTSLGITLKFSESGIDTGAPMGKSIMAFMSEMAEMDRKEILENTKRGREAALLSGKTKTGRPFGHPKKDLNVNIIRSSRLIIPPATKPVCTWARLEIDLKASRTLMIQHLKAAGFWDPIKKTVI
jgi:DNA invertase Pin-like site-specific DNA recombinase